MTKAIAATEQMSSGQIGQPAACMIENNPVLSSNELFWTRDYGPDCMPGRWRKSTNCDSCDKLAGSIHCMCG